MHLFLKYVKERQKNIYDNTFNMFSNKKWFNIALDVKHCVENVRTLRGDCVTRHRVEIFKFFNKKSTFSLGPRSTTEVGLFHTRRQSKLKKKFFFSNFVLVSHGVLIKKEISTTNTHFLCRKRIHNIIYFYSKLKTIIAK